MATKRSRKGSKSKSRYNRSSKGRLVYDRYRSGHKGIRNRLKHDHGYSSEAADILASRLLDSYERCAICGVPNRILAFFHRQGWPIFKGRHNQNKRLTVDHIIPGGPSVLGNTRLLCFGCNATRGANEKSDLLTLAEMRYNWSRWFSPAQTWWLNTEPGKGGKERRGKKHASP